MTSSSVALDGRGRVVTVRIDEPDAARAAERVCALLGDLLATTLVPLAVDLQPVTIGHVAVVSMREPVRTGRSRFHAGTALGPDAATALGQAACEALLRDLGGSILAGAARRLVEQGTARGVSIDVDGEHTAIGTPIGPRDRVRTLGLADARVAVLPAPGGPAKRRVDQWLARVRRAAQVSG